MKEIKLTQGKVALVDDEDFDFLNQWKWFANYCPSTNSYYAVRSLPRNGAFQKRINMHRLILGVTDPKLYVDHKNHDTLNNTKENLRRATPRQNIANGRSRKNSSSQYLGVNYSKSHQKWAARIGKDYKRKNLGFYDNEKDAAIAYNNAAIEVHGEFANLNII